MQVGGGATHQVIADEAPGVLEASPPEGQRDTATGSCQIADGNRELECNRLQNDSSWAEPLAKPLDNPPYGPGQRGASHDDEGAPEQERPRRPPRSVSPPFTEKVPHPGHRVPSARRIPDEEVERHRQGDPGRGRPRAPATHRRDRASRAALTAATSPSPPTAAGVRDATARRVSRWPSCRDWRPRC